MDGFGGTLPRRQLPEVQQTYEVGLVVMFGLASLGSIVGIAVDNLTLRLVAAPASTMCLVALLVSWRSRIG
jgi:hypothetical protein